MENDVASNQLCFVCSWNSVTRNQKDHHRKFDIPNFRMCVLGWLTVANTNSVNLVPMHLATFAGVNIIGRSKN